MVSCNLSEVSEQILPLCLFLFKPFPYICISMYLFIPYICQSVILLNNSNLELDKDLSAQLKGVFTSISCGEKVPS